MHVSHDLTQGRHAWVEEFDDAAVKEREARGEAGEDWARQYDDPEFARKFADTEEADDEDYVREFAKFDERWAMESRTLLTTARLRVCVCGGPCFFSSVCVCGLRGRRNESAAISR